MNDLSEKLINSLKGDMPESDIQNLLDFLETNPSLVNRLALATDSSVSVGGNVDSIYLGKTDSSPNSSDRPIKSELKAYCRRLLFQNAEISINGLGKPFRNDLEDLGIALVDVYVNLHSQSSKKVKYRKFNGLKLRTALSKPKKIIDKISQIDRLFVLGNAGSGKSTLIDFIALCLAGDFVNDPHANLERLGTSWNLPWLLPIAIKLREFAAWTLRENQPWSSDILWKFVSFSDLDSKNLNSSLLNAIKHEVEQNGCYVLLDGLDEVVDTKFQFKSFVEMLLTVAANSPKSRFLITSRPYAYDQKDWDFMNFTSSSLAPLSRTQIETFLYNWYLASSQKIKTYDFSTAIGRASNLGKKLLNDEKLAEMATNPLLLGMMAKVHNNYGGILPDKRERVFNDCLNLLFDQWERQRQILDQNGEPVLVTPSASEWFRSSTEDLLSAFELLGYRVHVKATSFEGLPVITEEDLTRTLAEVMVDDPDIRPRRIIEYASSRSGIIEALSSSTYTFPHKAFQEYLAARYLSRTEFPDLLIEKYFADPNHWREIVTLTGEKVSQGTPFALWSLIEALCPSTTTPEDSYAHHLAALISSEMLIVEKQFLDVPKRHKEKFERVRRNLITTIDIGVLPVEDRLKAGILLGILGDTRVGIGNDQSNIPIINWVSIQNDYNASIGSKTNYLSLGGDETPQQSISIPDFSISKYLVTNRQFDTFVDAGAYTSPEMRQYWTPGGVEWLIQGNGRYIFDDDHFLYSNSPVCGVNWFEAMAFCNWLTEKLRQNGAINAYQKVILPTEIQWEKAARRDSFNIYPWGDDFKLDICNSIYMGINHTSPVGIYPESKSLDYKIMDMSGNVWEWCREIWRQSYSTPMKLDDSLRASRPLRGGSFSSTKDDLRCAVRISSVPEQQMVEFGFRLALVNV